MNFILYKPGVNIVGVSIGHDVDTDASRNKVVGAPVQPKSIADLMPVRDFQMMKEIKIDGVAGLTIKNTTANSAVEIAFQIHVGTVFKRVPPTADDIPARN